MGAQYLGECGVATALSMYMRDHCSTSRGLISPPEDEGMHADQGCTALRAAEVPGVAAAGVFGHATWLPMAWSP
jgi:hypothetical protein